MAEAFRSGLEAVDRTQREAGECIGLTLPQTVRYVVLPQAFATAAPANCPGMNASIMAAAY